VQIVDDGDEEIHIDGWGDDAERMIGAKGEALLSLQFLLNRIVGSAEEKTPTVVLDVAGYRQRRKSALSHLAEKLAARACDEHKVVKLTPMSAHDRRVFHITLKEKEGVSTHSEGTGLYRNLFIVPEDSESANANNDNPE
jgi:spoIIIJ-associated protein